MSLVLPKKKRLTHLQHMQRCLDMGIKIYPVPISGAAKTKVRVVINNAGKEQWSKQIYDQDKVHKKIWELYENISEKLPT